MLYIMRKQLTVHLAGNDLVYYGERAIGATPKDAATSPFMKNLRQARQVKGSA